MDTFGPSGVSITRRNPPHWEIEGHTYFVTYRCVEGLTLRGEDRTAVLENWRYRAGKRYVFHAAVVMPDHVHVLITPTPTEEGGCLPLSVILHTNEGYSAQRINRSRGRTGRVWQGERYDRIIRSEQEYLEKWSYIVNNAVERKLVESPEDYEWLYQNADVRRE